MENSTNSERSLASLEGHRFDWGGKSFIVESYAQRAGREVLQTDRRAFVYKLGDRNRDAFLDEIKNIIPVPPKVRPKKPQGSFDGIVSRKKESVEPLPSPVGLGTVRKMKNTLKILTLKNSLMNADSSAIVEVSSNNAAKISTSLMDMFDKLSGDPTEADFKKAEAMSKMVHTIVSVEQVQINLLKLKNGK